MRVSVQSRDQPSLMDSIAILQRIPGPVSNGFQANIELMLAKNPPPNFGIVADPGDYEQFAADCRRLKNNEIHMLRELSNQTDLLTCCSIAILIAQYDYESFAATGTPNEYSHEIEFLASFLTGIQTDKHAIWSKIAALNVLGATRRNRRNSHRPKIVAALNALRAARRILILTKYELRSAGVGATTTYASFKAQPGFRGMFANQWLFLKGLFNPALDRQYVQALRHDLVSIGVPLPQLEGLFYILPYFLDKWTTAHREFARHVPSGQLKILMIDRSLESVSPSELSHQEVDVLAQYAQSIPIDYRAMIHQVPHPVVEEIEAWVTRFSAPRESLGLNTTGSPFYPSPLTNKPFLRERDVLLLTLPHRLATDLSNLIHSSWAQEYGEKYFKTRGRVLESLAVDALVHLLPNCSSITNATYKTADGKTVEIDGAVIWHDVCFLVESKSGYLSLRARQGVDEAATEDLKDTIGDGFYQASRFLHQLEMQHEVLLRDAQGQQLLLRRKKIRRAYVILPTADYLGGITTMLERLWSNNILASGSLPLLISIQDLLFLAKIFPSGLEFISYLDYREEVLERDNIFIADDLEMLGSFVAGQDIIGNVNSRISENLPLIASFDSERHPVFAFGTIQQELYIDSWLTARATAQIQGTAEPAPPRRHGERERARIESMWEKWKDLESASIAHQVDRNALRSALDRKSQPQATDLLYATMNETTFIAFGSKRKFREVRKNSVARGLRTSSRHVLYCDSFDGELRLRYAEYGRKHFAYRGVENSLLVNSRLGDQDSWFRSFSERRMKKRHRMKKNDRTAETALQTEGLDRSLAVGISRLEIADKWRQLVQVGVTPTQAANVWLGPLSEIAKEMHVHPKTLDLSSERIRDALKLVSTGELDSKSLPRLLACMLDDPKDPASLAQTLGIAKSSDERMVRQAIDVVVREQKSRIAATGSDRAREKLRNELIGCILSREPQANKKLVAELLDWEFRKTLDP